MSASEPAIKLLRSNNANHNIFPGEIDDNAAQILQLPLLSFVITKK